MPAADRKQLNQWKIKALKSDYYKNAIHVWTVKDVEKREAARKNHLNYVVFWDNQLRDAEIWFEQGCPDGQDWETMWSWMNV